MLCLKCYYIFEDYNIHIHIYIYIHIYAYIHTHTHTHIYIHIHIYMCVYVYTYIYTRLPHITWKPVSIWCDHHLPHAVQHISFAYIWSGCWLWPVEYWSTPLAVRSCRILAGTGKRCRIRRSKASQTCSMSGEYAGHARIGMCSATRNCVQILATWGRALSWCNMRWWSWMNGTTMGLRISSRYLCAFKMPSIKCTCVRCP